MPPFVFQINCGPPEETATCTCKPNLSFLHTFNHAGGRPTERIGSRGSFTPGVRIMSGGPSRHVPVEGTLDAGTVLGSYPNLKPDLSEEPRTNVVGGRPTERLGVRGRFTPGARCWRGGKPRDVPLKAEINRGTVLFTYPELKPDMSSEARTNAVRPTERLGSRGSFTPGQRVLLGGKPRDVPLKAEINAGTVLHTYPDLKPDMSEEARTNVVGGRPTERLGSNGSFKPGMKRRLGGAAHDVPLEREINPGTVLFAFPYLKPDMSGEALTNVVRPSERLGRRGSFTPGAKRAWRGGTPRDVPVETEVDHGTVLFTYPNLKPDISCEACTNVIGGRPTERLGSAGSFTPGTSHWLGGEPKDVPLEREFVDHGLVLFPPAEDTAAGLQPGVEEDQSNFWFFQSDVMGGGEEEEEMVNESPLPLQQAQAQDASMFSNAAAVQHGLAEAEKAGGSFIRRSGSDSMFPGTAAAGNDGVFRRCGSDSKFPTAGADLMSMSGSFPAV